MSSDVAITLPRGLFDHSGGRHREAVLSPITGHFEAQLAESRELTPAAVSVLLAHAFSSIGAFERVDASHTAALSRGDRDYALLHLRRGMFGDRLPLIVRCPNPACYQEADLALKVSELAPWRSEPAPETFVVETVGGPVTLRESTGADDAAVFGLPKRDATNTMWARLVVDFAGQGPLRVEQWAILDPSVRHAIAAGLADASSGPTLAFLVPCPSCGAWIDIELDPADLLARELAVAVDRLFAEVHTLAYGYHWSEHDILSLPRARRFRYLNLIANQLGRKSG